MSTSQIALLASVQQFLDRQHGLYIDGAPCAAQSENRLTVWDPATGQAIATTAEASPADVDRAVMYAWRAFVDRRWAGRTPADRERILLRFADLVEQHGEELAQLETLEQGKSIAISRAFEVGCTLNWMRYTAGLTTKISGRTLDVSIPFPQGARYQAWTKKEPVGVVAGIVPWNFPLMIGMWKVMPALAAGCSIVIKPSETTPLTLLRVAELATLAGIPDGVFNVVTGSGAGCGAALTAHPQVAKVSFTGSTATGKQIARVAADRLTRVTLELGGKNPAIVLKAADPQWVIEGLMTGSFLNQGQVCAASSRIYIEAPLFDTLVSGFEQAVKSLQVGPGMQETAQINPVVSRAHCDKVAAYLDEARQQKAERISVSAGPDLNRLGFTTDLNEQDVIMGRGERRLFHAVRHIVDRYHPAAVFIYNTCVPAMEGDDLEAVCQAAQTATGVPVIAIDAAGFYGSKNLGNRMAGDVMLRQVIGQREPAPWPDNTPFAPAQRHDIGLIGEFNIAGEFWQVQPLLDELGIRILGSLSGDGRFAEIQTLHRAQANMLVCSRALINVARGLELRYGTPWFEGSFYGIRATSDALRQLATLLGDDDLRRRTDALIAREEQAAEQALAPWREQLRGRKVLLYTGGVKSWSVVSALQDLGMTVVATGTRKSTEEDKQRIRALMGDEAVMLEEGNARTLLDVVYRYQADLMIAGGRNMYTAWKARLPFLDINQEREHAYAGYQGIITLARQLCLTLASPVWPQTHTRAPWR